MLVKNRNKMLFSFSLVPVSAVSVLTSSEGSSLLGGLYTLTCIVSKPYALSATPEIVWVNSDGFELTVQANSTDLRNTTIASATVVFDPLLLSHSGIYTCQVSLITEIFSQPLNSSVVVSLNVHSKAFIIQSKVEAYDTLYSFFFFFSSPTFTGHIYISN